MICVRCEKETKHFIVSFFNTDTICMECKEVEKLHPRYEEAKEIEHHEVVKGNYNYEGIGLPDDYEEFVSNLNIEQIGCFYR